MQYKILFRNRKPISVEEIANSVKKFGRSYDRTVRKIIKDSNMLTEETFKKNAAILLINFRMVRNGPFKGIKVNGGKIEDPKDRLKPCWNETKDELLLVKTLLNNKKIDPRTRTLLLIDEDTKKQVILHLWCAFKKILPISMGQHSYGLVGASKILFSAFPEIVLPVDNAEWLKVFKTVDLGDVIIKMSVNSLTPLFSIKLGDLSTKSAPNS